MVSMNSLKQYENISIQSILMHFFLRQYSWIFTWFSKESNVPKWLKSRSRWPFPQHWTRPHWRLSLLIFWREPAIPTGGLHFPQWWWEGALLCLKSRRGLYQVSLSLLPATWNKQQVQATSPFSPFLQRTFKSRLCLLKGWREGEQRPFIALARVWFTEPDSPCR